MKYLLLTLAAGCGMAVDVEPIVDYKSWGAPIIVTGEAPGHADSYRAIYVNDLARDPTQSFVLGYQEGSIIVKEIRENNDGQPGDLRYLAIMRRIGSVTKSFENKGGWLYTKASEEGATEKEFDLCWSRCHVAAPYNGAWYDYREE